MSKPDNYSIGHDIISKYEKELLDSLPQLYPDEGDRQFIREALIPHFRIKLQEVFESFLYKRRRGNFMVDRYVPISEHETPDLCLQIDKMIQENREFLLMDGLFRPVIGQIQNIRPQVKEELHKYSKQKFIDAFAVHGITDRQSLLAKGPSWFASKEAHFPPYGGGYAIIGIILNKTAFETGITRKILEQVADILFPETKEDSKQGFIDAFAAHGITDRQSFFRKSSSWYKKTKFPPYGKGSALFGSILGRTVYDITRKILEQVADKLDLPEFSEYSKQKFIDAFAAHGITDRQSLLAKGPSWFASKEAHFPPYGKGKALIRAIIGRKFYVITVEILGEVADKLGWIKLPEDDKKQDKIDLLASYDMFDQRTIIAKGPSWFASKEAHFPPYGGGRIFISNILNKKCFHNITVSILIEMSDKLGLPVLSDVSKKKIIDAFVAHGITDRHTLFAKVSWLERSGVVDFSSYGTVKSSLRIILGRPITKVTLDVLHEVADILFPETEEDSKQKFIDAFAVHGITDRKSLIKKTVSWYIRSKDAIFHPYGKAFKFFAKILDKKISSISIDILNEVADKLGWD